MPRDERKSVFGPLNDKRQTRQINDLYRITRQNSTLIAGAGASDMTLAGVQTVTGAKTFNDTTFLLNNVAGTFNGSFVNTNTADRIYTLQDVAGTVAFLSDTVLTAKVTVTAAQINAIGTTPIQLIAAPGAGKYIKVLGADAWMTFVSTIYDNNTLDLTMGGAAFSKTNANLLDALATANAIFNPIDGGIDVLLANTALAVTGTDSAVETGDSDIDIYVTYKIMTI